MQNWALVGARVGCGKQLCTWLVVCRPSGFGQMRSHINSGITSCAKANSRDKALNLFRLLESNGRKLDVTSYGAATNACDRGARWQYAIYLKDIAGVADQSDKSLSYFATSCIGASSRLGRLECAMQIYRQLRANCSELSIISCTALCTADGRPKIIQHLTS